LNGGTGSIAFDSSVSAQNVYLQADNSGHLTVKILRFADIIAIGGDLKNNSGTVTERHQPAVAVQRRLASISNRIR